MLSPWSALPGQVAGDGTETQVDALDVALPTRWHRDIEAAAAVESCRPSALGRVHDQPQLLGDPPAGHGEAGQDALTLHPASRLERVVDHAAQRAGGARRQGA